MGKIYLILIDYKPYRLLFIIFFLFLIITGYEFIFVKEQLNHHNNEKSKNTITFLTTNLPPFSYLNNEGDLRGSLVELVKIIAERTNTSYSLEMLPMSAAYQQTLSTPCTGLFPLGKNKEREPLFKWVGPVDLINYAYYCSNSDNMMNTTEDEIKCSQIVTVPRSTARHSLLLEKGFSNLLLLSNDAECVQAVLDHKADVWFGSINLYKIDRQFLGDDLNSLRMVCSGENNPLYIGFNIDTPDEMIEKWQNEFQTLEPEVKSQIMGQQFPYFCSWIGCKNC